MENSNKRPLEDGCQYSHTETKKPIAAQVTTTISHPKSSKEIVGFQDLSDDVVLYLFKYLSHDNLAKMALICPNLLRVSHDWSLWKKPRFEKFEKYMEDVYLSYLKEDTIELFISCNDVLSSDYSVTRTFLVKLELKCPELLHLTLKNQVLDAAEISVKLLHRKLKTLTIDNTTIENNQDISSYLCGINKACPDLERIIMTNNDWISPHCFYELFNLKHLNYLSFAGCKQFMFDIMPSIIPITGFECLQTLDLRFTPVSDIELICFKSLTTLTTLLLESPEYKKDNRIDIEPITDLGLAQFFAFYDVYYPYILSMFDRHGNELDLRGVYKRYGMETLYVRNYQEVTGEFLKFVASACPNLKLLDITGSCCTSETIRSFKANRPSTKLIMKNAISYCIIVSSVNNENIQTIVPKSWIINKESENPIVGKMYEWYWPTELGTKRAEQNVEVDYNWDKKIGQVLDITDSYLEANFIVIKIKINQSKFAIIEFLNEQAIEVVPCSWIKVDHISKRFICCWPGSKNVSKFALSQKNPINSWEEHDCLPRTFFETHALAKKKLLSFCYTSSTEIEETKNRRKHIKRKRFNSYSSDEDLNNDSKKEKQKLNTHLNKKKTQNKKVAIDSNYSDESDSIFNIKFKNVIDTVPPTGSFDLFNCDESADELEFLLNSSNQVTVLPIAEKLVKDGQSLIEDYSQPLTIHDDHVPDTTQMLMNIGHVLKNVAGQINILKKDNETLKVDLAKNQEYLVDLIRIVNNKGFNNEDKNYFDRSNLKIPVKNVEELKALESRDEQKKILAQVLRRNGKSFDSKRTTCQMLKILMDNRVVEHLNADGKRGIKLAFVKMDLYTILIDSVKHLFPDEPVPLIKNQISDPLKQAPRRK